MEILQAKYQVQIYRGALETVKHTNIFITQKVSDGIYLRCNDGRDKLFLMTEKDKYFYELTDSKAAIEKFLTDTWRDIIIDEIEEVGI